MNLIQNYTALLLVLAIFASIRNFIIHLEHDDHEGVAKWAVITLLFGISLLVSLFA